MTYLIDTNVFITAKRTHYGFDFCPAFWDWLCLKNTEGKVFSIRKVAEELKEKSDDLWKWAKKRGDNFFLVPDESVLHKLATVAKEANEKDYRQIAKRNFMNSADHFLIAHAMAHSYTIVTHEVRKKNSKKVIKIPDICDLFGILCTTPYELLRKENAQFVLG